MELISLRCTKGPIVRQRRQRDRVPVHVRPLELFTQLSPHTDSPTGLSDIVLWCRIVRRRSASRWLIFLAFWAHILPLRLIESIIVCPMVASVFNCCDRNGDRSRAWFANRPTKLMVKLQCRLIGTFPSRNIGCTLGQYRWSRMGIRMASDQDRPFSAVFCATTWRRAPASIDLPQQSHCATRSDACGGERTGLHPSQTGVAPSRRNDKTGRRRHA
jgi:hypothetical protein